MPKIELFVSTAMSLLAISSAGSEEPDELDEVNEDETTNEEDDVATAIMSTSDEDFENLSPEDFEKSITEDENLGDDNVVEDEPDANEDENDDTAVPEDSEQADSEDNTEDNQPSEEEQTDAATAEQMKEAYDLLFANPIKASGREVQIRNPQHAKNFIEMGMDYNRKMQSMKPHLKALKTLEKEGLLDDEETLNLLLEVKHGNKDALKRLIAESDIDPLEFADEAAIKVGKDYQPQNHLVSEREVEIEEALDAIRNSDFKEKTLDVMTKEFDKKSREIISDNPSYIVALNRDMETGAYDAVMDAMNYKRDMRKVPTGMSDMELYIETARELATQPENSTVEKQESAPEQKKAQRRVSSKSDKARMSGTKSSRKPQNKEFDPLDIMEMSDADFDKKFGGTLQ